uniref:Uncharacterized protein n=1 Tax=Mycena chlorophos TaxID=658473 RepID=A0ABQ0LCY0_MYCCL|nr:predicted protein [Mycena chlorophos]
MAGLKTKGHGRRRDDPVALEDLMRTTEMLVKRNGTYLLKESRETEHEPVEPVPKRVRPSQELHPETVPTEQVASDRATRRLSGRRHLDMERELVDTRYEPSEATVGAGHARIDGLHRGSGPAVSTKRESVV